MKKVTIVILLVLVFLFLVAFPGISSLLTASQKMEDLALYCQKSSPLVEKELEMYQLYYQGDFDSIHKKAQLASYNVLACKPKTEEVDELYKRYLVIWDNWSNDNYADLFGYGYEDNVLIRYHEDVLKMAKELGVSDAELGSYSKANWKTQKKVIVDMSKRYLLGTD